MLYEVITKVSVINPELMTTVTPDYLAYSAVDIFAHCLDLYFTAKVFPEFTAALIENILSVITSYSIHYTKLYEKVLADILRHHLSNDIFIPRIRERRLELCFKLDLNVVSALSAFDQS